MAVPRLEAVGEEGNFVAEGCQSAIEEAGGVFVISIGGDGDGEAVPPSRSASTKVRRPVVELRLNTATPSSRSLPTAAKEREGGILALALEYEVLMATSSFGRDGTAFSSPG